MFEILSSTRNCIPVKDRVPLEIVTCLEIDMELHHLWMNDVFFLVLRNRRMLPVRKLHSIDTETDFHENLLFCRRDAWNSTSRLVL